jgi:hypothetical protein
MATTGWQELRRVGERLLSDEKVNPESLEALSPSITAQVSAETLSHPTRIPKCAEVQIERVQKRQHQNTGATSSPRSKCDSDNAKIKADAATDGRVGALRNSDLVRLFLRLHLLVGQQEGGRGPCQSAISPLRISAFPSPHHAAGPPAPIVLQPEEPVQTRKEGSEDRVGQTIFMTRIDPIACDNLVWPSHTDHRAPHGLLCLLLEYQHFFPP